MHREVIDVASGPDGRLFAASTVLPSQDRAYECWNRVHILDGSRWKVIAKWIGWQITSLGIGTDFAVCAGIKGDLHFIRNQAVESVRHPERERALHTQFATPSTIYVGGSTGYYLTIDRTTGAVSAHNLRDFGIDKPGRDIYSIQALTDKDGLLFCGANRLLLEVCGPSATALVPPGPTAGTPNLVGAALLGDTIYPSSHGGLWQFRSGDLHPITLPPEVQSQIGFITASEGRIVTGAQSLYSISDRLEHELLFQQPSPRAYLTTFTQVGAAPVAVYSDGTLLEVGHTIKNLPGILGARAA